MGLLARAADGISEQFLRLLSPRTAGRGSSTLPGARRPLRGHLAAPERDRHPAAPRPAGASRSTARISLRAPSPGRESSPSWEHQHRLPAASETARWPPGRLRLHPSSHLRRTPVRDHPTQARTTSLRVCGLSLGKQGPQLGMVVRRKQTQLRLRGGRSSGWGGVTQCQPSPPHGNQKTSGSPPPRATRLRPGCLTASPDPCVCVCGNHRKPIGFQIVISLGS